MDPNRLVLASVHIQNFKSVRQPVTLQLSRKTRLLAIVGANGAGESLICLPSQRGRSDAALTRWRGN